MSKGKLRFAQFLIVVLIGGLLLLAMWRGGLLGSLIVGGICIIATLLLISRWQQLDSRTRIARAGIVVIGLLVALSLLVRG